MRHFDLNIEKILENWETYHAIREVISNAIDEQFLTDTNDVEIYQQGENWHIKDYGRGLKYTNLTQNENQEKLLSPNVIGKFGIGLKDALATFERKDVNVFIKSKHGDIDISKSPKEGFDDIITLHANIFESSDPNFIGTEFILNGITEDDIQKAKNLFLKFSGEYIIESTTIGDIVNKSNEIANIYVNGVRVAQEESFLFSYNITHLTKPIKKALNRERSNVGRTAYTDSIKKILLECKSIEVAERLSEDLQSITYGTAHDELSWLDVQEHSVKILNQNKEKVLFVSSDDVLENPNMIDEAKNTGHQIISIPRNLTDRIRGNSDYSGKPIVDINRFVRNYNESFQYEFIPPENLTYEERQIYNRTYEILNLIGGKPDNVQAIKISTNLRKGLNPDTETLGVWESKTNTIIIHRKKLHSVRDYAGTLIHEAIHAKTGFGDVERRFERELTKAIGQVCEKVIAQ